MNLNRYMNFLAIVLASRYVRVNFSFIQVIIQSLLSSSTQRKSFEQNMLKASENVEITI